MIGNKINPNVSILTRGDWSPSQTGIGGGIVLEIKVVGSGYRTKVWTVQAVLISYRLILKFKPSQSSALHSSVQKKKHCCAIPISFLNQHVKTKFYPDLANMVKWKHKGEGRRYDDKEKDDE